MCCNVWLKSCGKGPGLCEALASEGTDGPGSQKAVGEHCVFPRCYNYSPLLPPTFPVHPTLKLQWGLCSLCPNQELRQRLRVIGTEMARAQNAAAGAQVTII